MEKERKNGVAEDIVEEEEPVAVVGNEELDGGLKTRSRKKRLLEKEGETEDDAVVDSQVGVEHESSVYVDREQGIKTSDETNSTELEKADLLVADKSMQNHEINCLANNAKDFPDIENCHHRRDLKVENQPISEEHERILAGQEFVSKSEQAVPLDKNKSVVEMDLERILEEQDTHDLYCPNCHSCITKRVILRKRKRTVRENISDAKREKIEPVQADLIADTIAAEDTGESHDTEPDVFRCLSCLSFFIPTDTGFRLFKIFGKREENDVQSSQRMPGRPQNWMFSFFELMKRKNKESGLESHDGYGHGVDDLQGKDQQITPNAWLSETVPLGMPQSDFKEEQINANKSKDAVEDPLLAKSHDGYGNEVDDLQRKDQQRRSPSAGLSETVLLGKPQSDFKEEKINANKSKDAEDGIISILKSKMEPVQGTYLEGPPRSDSSLATAIAPALPILGETRIHLGEQTMAEARQTHQWDVLKAIVYGGLLESIASLGIISSAAGSDVTTLNVIALGFANLVGGLFVMIHNLVELKNEQYKSISTNKKEEADRYRELLGRRGYFCLHATVALISYIFVGVLPPIIYGFSFREMDNKEYKMIAVIGASLLCITLLAIGKAHVQEGQKPYVKTLLYYVGLGFGASGLSYALGMLIKKLIQELGLFDDSIAVPTPHFSSILEVTSRTSSW